LTFISARGGREHVILCADLDLDARVFTSPQRLPASSPCTPGGDPARQIMLIEPAFRANP
jgi:hypothetical protein